MFLTDQRTPKRQSGFTIVELLIVIIVIAILAAIVIIAYNGIRIRAIDSRIQSDLSTAGSKLGTLHTTDSDSLYAANFSETGIPSSSDEGKTLFLYNVNPERTEYCLQAVNSGRTWFITEDNTAPQPGICEGINGVVGSGNADEVDVSGSQTFLVTNTSQTSQFRSIEIPAGVDYVSFETSGGTRSSSWGINIRVRQGAQPTSATKDCQSAALTANYENCYITSPTAGTWYIEDYPISTETYTDVSLVVRWGYFEGEYTEPLTLSSSTWPRKIYTVNISEGTDFLLASTAGGTYTSYGANIAVKHGSPPGDADSATDGATCYSQSWTDNADHCFINDPTPGTWYISVFASGSPSYESTFTNATFTVETGTYNAYSAPVTISAGPWSRKIYSYTVPSGVDYVSFATTGGTETGYGSNVAVRYNAIPGNSTDPDSGSTCYDQGSTNYDNCFIYNPTAGTWYASVFSGGMYAATYSNVDFSIQTGNWAGAYTGPTSVSGGNFHRNMYTYTVPEGATSLTATLSGGTETGYGANLAVRHATPPGDGTSPTTSAACSSQGSTNTESCVVSNPAAGTWYIEVFSSGLFSDTSTFSNVTLTVTSAP